VVITSHAPQLSSKHCADKSIIKKLSSAWLTVDLLIGLKDKCVKCDCYLSEVTMSLSLNENGIG